MVASRRYDTTLSISTGVTACGLYKKASKPFARKIRGVLYALRNLAWNTRRGANGVGNARKLEGAIYVNAVVSSGIYGLATAEEEASAGLVAGVVRLEMEDHGETRKALKLSVED